MTEPHTERTGLHPSTIDSDLSSDRAEHLEQNAVIASSTPDHVVALAVIAAVVASLGIIATTVTALWAAAGH